MARLALIVATGTYDDPKLQELRAPAVDARELAGVLEDPDVGDFAVDTLLDSDEMGMRKRIRRFFGEASRDDVLLLHLSCHGIKDDAGDLYFAGTDTELQYPDVSAAWLNDQIARSLSRQILLLLDCCFSGRFSFGAHRAGERVDVHDHFEGRGQAVITASSAMEYAFEDSDRSGEGQPSFFTQAVIDALRTGEADRDQDRWISVDELYNYVFDRVKQQTPNQTPSKHSRLEGPLYVARSSYEMPVEPADLDKHVLDLAINPLPDARLGAVAILAELLTSPSKSMALAAQKMLEEMVGDDSRKVSERVRLALSALAASSVTPVGEDSIQATPAEPDSTGVLASETSVDTPVETVPEKSAPTREPSARTSSGSSARTPEESPAQSRKQPATAPDHPAQPVAANAAIRPKDAGALPAIVPTVWTTAEKLVTLPEQFSGNRLDVARGVAFSPDARRLATALTNGEVRIHALPDAEEIFRAVHASPATSVCFSPDGELLASSGMDSKVRVSSVADGREIAMLQHDRTVFSVAFSPDGRNLVTGARGGLVSIWEVASWRRISDWKLDLPLSSKAFTEDIPCSVAFNPDGRLVAAGVSNTVRVRQVDGTDIYRRTKWGGLVRCVAFSPSRRHIASAWEDGKVRVASMPYSREISVMRHGGRAEKVYGVAFSPCGQYLASASGSGCVRLCSTTDWTLTRMFKHGALAHAVAFSRDGALLAAGTGATTVWGPSAYFSNSASR